MESKPNGTQENNKALEQAKEIIDKVSGQRSGKNRDEKKSFRNKSGRRGSHGKDSDGKRHARNDAHWWMKYPELSKGALNFVFNTIAGTEFYDPNAAENPTPNNIAWPVVGASLKFHRCIGKATQATDPFNYQMRALWLDMHRKYRGMGSYQSADLGMAIFSIIGAMSDIARAERMYGISCTFNARNRSYPTAIMKAIGLDPRAVNQDRVADFRFQINRLILKAKTLCLPKGIAALDCYTGLLGAIFKDSENIRAQWFVYDDPYRLVYDHTRLSTGGCVSYRPRTATGNDGLQLFEDVIADLEADLDSLLRDDDVARMCSDLLAAYGDKGVTTLEPLAENYSIEPVYESTRVSELMNTTLTGLVVGTDFPSEVVQEIGSSFTSAQNHSMLVYQVGNVVRQSLSPLAAEAWSTFAYVASPNQIDTEVAASTTLSDNAVYLGEPMANCKEDAPSDETLVDMLTQMYSKTVMRFNDHSSTFYAYHFDSYGPYIVADMNLWSNQDCGTIIGVVDKDVFRITNREEGEAVARLIAALSSIDWHPKVFTMTQSRGINGMVWDIDNYTLVPRQALRRIHETMVLSAFKMDVSIIEA